MDGGTVINSRRKQVFLKENLDDSFDDDFALPNGDIAPVMEEDDELNSLLEEIREPPDALTQAEIDSTLLLIRMKHPNEFGPNKLPAPFRNVDGKRRVRQSALKYCLESDIPSATASFFTHHLTSIHRADNCVEEASTSDSLVEHQRPAKPSRRPLTARVEELCFVPELTDGLAMPSRRRNAADAIDGSTAMARAGGGFRLFTRTFSDRALAGCLRHPLFDTGARRQGLPRHLRLIYLLRQLWLNLPEDERYDWQQLHERFINTELSEFCRFVAADNEKCLESEVITRQQLRDRQFVQSVDVDRLPCPLCERTTPRRFSISQLHIHLNQAHHAVHVYACQFCSKGFLSQDLLKSHICEQFQEYYACVTSVEESVFTFNYSYVSLICVECGFHLILSPKCEEELFTSSFINCILTHNGDSFMIVNVFTAAPLPAGNVRIGFHRLLPGGDFPCSYCPERVTLKTEEGERVELTTQTYSNAFDLDKHLRMSHKKEATAMKCTRCPAYFFNVDVYRLDNRDHILSHAQEVPSVTLFFDWAPVFPPLLERRYTFIRMKNHVDFERFVAAESREKSDEPECSGGVEVRRSVRRKRKSTTLEYVVTEDTKCNIKDAKKGAATWTNYCRMLAEVSEIGDVSWLKSHTEFSLPVAFDGRTIVGNTVNGFVLNDDVFECKKCNSVHIGETAIIEHLKQCCDAGTQENGAVDLIDLLESDGIEKYVHCLFDANARLPFGRLRCAHCSTTHCSVVSLTKHCALAHSISLRLNKNDSVIQEAADDVLQKKWCRTAFDDYLAEEIANATLLSSDSVEGSRESTADAKLAEDEDEKEDDNDDCFQYLNREPSAEPTAHVPTPAVNQIRSPRRESLDRSESAQSLEAEPTSDDGRVEGVIVKDEVEDTPPASPVVIDKAEPDSITAPVEKPAAAQLTLSHPRATGLLTEHTKVGPGRPRKSFSVTASGEIKVPDPAGMTIREMHAAPKERDNLYCEYCSFATLFHTKLMEHHKEVHSEGKEYGLPVGVSVYLCRSCCCAFIRLSEYERHMTSHSQPIACKKCSCVSGRDSEFLEHRQNHNSRSAIFACTICSIMYTREVMFMLHMVKHHDMRLAYFCKTCGICNTNLATIFDHITYEPCRKLMTIDFIGFVDASQILFLPSSAALLNRALNSSRPMKMIELNKCRHNRCLNSRAEPLVSCYNCNCLTTLMDFKKRSELSDDEIKKRVKFELAKDNNLLTLQCILQELSKPVVDPISRRLDTVKVQAIRSATGLKNVRRYPLFEPAYDQLQQLNVAPTLTNLRTKLVKCNEAAVAANAMSDRTVHIRENESQFAAESPSRLRSVTPDVDEQIKQRIPVRKSPTKLATKTTIHSHKTASQNDKIWLNRVKQEPSEMDELVAEMPSPVASEALHLPAEEDDDDDLEVVGVKLAKPRTVIRPRAVADFGVSLSSTSSASGLDTTRPSPLHPRRLRSSAMPHTIKTEPIASISNTRRPQQPQVRPQLISRATFSSAPAGAPPAKRFMERFKHLVEDGLSAGDSPAKKRQLGTGKLPDPMPPSSLFTDKTLPPLPTPLLVAAKRSVVHSIRLVPENGIGSFKRPSSYPYPKEPIRVETMRVPTSPQRGTSMRSVPFAYWDHANKADLEEDDCRRDASSSSSGVVTTVVRPRAKPPGGVALPYETWKRKTRALMDDKEVISHRLEHIRYHMHPHRYLCVTCMATHVQQSDAVLHQFHEHGAENIRYSLMCPVCKSVYTDLTLFYAHLVTDKRHTKLTYRSEWCNFTFGTEEEVAQHNHEHASTANKLNMPCGVNCCGICGTVNNYWFERLNDRTFIDHTVFHGFRSAAVCRLCTARFDTDKMAFKHYTENHLQRTETKKSPTDKDVRRCKGCRRDVKQDLLFDHFNGCHKFVFVEYVPEMEHELVITASTELQNRFHI